MSKTFTEMSDEEYNAYWDELQSHIDTFTEIRVVGGGKAYTITDVWPTASPKQGKRVLNIAIKEEVRLVDPVAKDIKARIRKTSQDQIDKENNDKR